MRPPTSRRAVVLSAVVTAMVGVLVPAGPAVAAAEEAPGSGAARVVQVGEVDVPILGTFAERGRRDADSSFVHGAVHGVQRIDGATVLYFSAGLPDTTFRWQSFYSVLNMSQYPSDVAAQMYLVDRVGQRVYKILTDDKDTLFATNKRQDLVVPEGQLGVQWGVFPELPASVREVDVVLGEDRVVVPRVPVARGLLEPVVDQPVPRIGTGWPRIPDQDAIAAADHAASVFPLVQRTADVEGETSTAESAEDVMTTLDANVLFDTGSAELTPAAQEVLARVAADVAERAEGEAVVTGHTDSEGGAAFNQDLSERRAAAVVAALEPGAGGDVTFRAAGRGERDPVAPNDSPENMQLNRRVTVEYAIVGGDA